MKTVTMRPSFQGDVMILRIAALPKKNLKAAAAEKGRFIIAHSETGHHHVVDADCATLTRIDQFTALLNVIKPTKIDHLREFNTHPSIALQPGMYEFRSGREFDPYAELARKQID